MAKLKWGGMIGGGEGSQIGPAHRWVPWPTGILNSPQARWTTVRMWGGENTHNVLESLKIAPMATGPRCWRAKRTATTGSTW